MRITNYEQGSPDWHHARCGVRTASRFGDVMAISPEKWRVVRSTGTLVKVFDSAEAANDAAGTKYIVEHVPAEPLKAYNDYLLEQAQEIITGVFDEADGWSSFWTDRGLELEPRARKYYEFITGNTSTECGLILTDDGSAGASVDGLVGDDGQNEIKCLKRTNHVEILLADEVPEKFIPQIQGQLFVTGRKWCDFISYHPDAHIQGFIKRVERDEVYIARLKSALDRFNKDLDAMIERLLAMKEAA